MARDTYVWGRFSGNTYVKVTDGNRESKKTVYTKEIECGKWTKTADRQLVWEHDPIDKDVYSHCICVYHTRLLRVGSTTLLTSLCS